MRYKIRSLSPLESWLEERRATSQEALSLAANWIDLGHREVQVVDLEFFHTYSEDEILAARPDGARK